MHIYYLHRQNPEQTYNSKLIVHKIGGGPAIGVYSHADPVCGEAIGEFVVDISLTFGGKSKYAPVCAGTSRDFDNLVGPPETIAEEVYFDSEVYAFGLIMRHVEDFFIEAGH